LISGEKAVAWRDLIDLTYMNLDILWIFYGVKLPAITPDPANVPNQPESNLGCY
jgi:hypothetical protein